MNKFALTSLLAISIAAPAFGAVGDKTINAGANSAPCTSATLDTPTGPAALEADWTANTIKINWDAKNGTTINPTQCVYDDTLNLPATPSKTGYTFGGWTVAVSGGNPIPQQQNCFANFPSILMDANLEFSPIGATDGQNATWWTDLATGYVDEDTGEEVADAVYGRVTGISKCSSAGNGYDEGSPGTPSDENGQYCWCQVSTYTPTGGQQCTVSSPSWVLTRYTKGCANNCARLCAVECTAPDFRAVLFDLPD